jgi:hypothetical protein
MYRIIGSDQREYGPVSADEVRRWIAEGRLHPKSLVRTEGTTEWKPLASFAEFAGAFLAQPVPTAATLVPVQQSNSMATLGVVFSSLGLVCCCSPFAILGLIFSCIGLSQANRDPLNTGKPAAIAGIVLGIISLAGSIAGLFLGLFGELLEQFGKF